MDQLEIEVKFFPQDMASVKRRLKAAGARSSGRQFETNIVYDTPDARLKTARSLLRLRKDRHTTLTFKSPPDQSSRAYKIHRELEVTVSDFGTMQRILASIGYRPQFVYEKWRETFRLNRAHICIDTLPYGNFVEIEADRAAIHPIAMQLGLPWESRILKNYHELFCIVRREMNLCFDDITFAAFRDVVIDPDKFHHLFLQDTNR